jgi:hypothetical protein
VLWTREGAITARPSLSLVPNENSVNQIEESPSCIGEMRALILAEQLFAVFDKADDHHHG